jgi:hypothetical protein
MWRSSVVAVIVVASIVAGLDGAAPRELPGETGLARTAMQSSEHDVVPIMLRRCTVCHGLRKREAGLDLRTRAGMLAGGKSGPAIVPGNSSESLLIQRIRAGEMPPLRRVVEVSVKPIEPGEIDTVARWIDAGALPAAAETDSARDELAASLIEKNRNFWSFQTPQRPAIPTYAPQSNAQLVAGSSHDAASVEPAWETIRNPIDAFVLQKLARHGKSFAPEADRLQLMRRATIDLTGLPPLPEDVLEYMADTDPLAYEKMIDRLLASPRYGERWGRHWLDVAGYADSEGKTDQDLRRPYAWRYRDYVIRSFNADKPYDRFLIEQLAGDELADYEHASEISQETYDNLVATGFLRMAPDGTFANITNFVPDRLEVIADEVQVLGSGVMGLTLHCARCHNHKFDPIPQRDYYRLLDVFKGAYDEHDWLKPNPSDIASSGDWGHRLLPYVTTEERRRWESNDRRLADEIQATRHDLELLAAPLQKKHSDERLGGLPAQIQDDVRRMLATPAGERTEVQKYLAEKFEKAVTIDLEELKKLDPEFKKTADENDKRANALSAQRTPEPKIHALWDRGSPSPTYVLRRGDYLMPTQLVTPGVPAVLASRSASLEVQPPWPRSSSTGRRLAFARWLTEPTHPLTARVMVNRIWKHHFGAGLVKTLGNFGTTGTPPTHPELLDWLALEFANQGWSVKHIHRLIMTSTTYRQASGRSTSSAHDGDGELYSHMILRRMDAEVLYDSLLCVAGRLDDNRFGPPDAVDVSKDGQVTTAAKHGAWRRSIYVEQRRKQIPTLLENFDLPAMSPNCVERTESNVAPQALHLFNSGMVHKLALHFAERLMQTAGSTPGDRVRRAYIIAFCRPPTDDELEIGVQALEQLAAEWSRKPANAGSPGSSDLSADTRALASFCHALLNAAEFLYVD